MTKITATLALVFLFFCQLSFAQDTWFKRYNGGGNEVIFSASETNDGGVIMAGYTDNPASDSLDFYIVRTDEHGEQLWTTTIGTQHNDSAFHAIQLSNGNYAVTGLIHTHHHKDSIKLAVYILDANGQVKKSWIDSIYQSSAGHYILEKDPDTLYITGRVSNGPPLEESAMLLKIGPNANYYDLKGYGGNGYNEGNLIVADPNGNFGILGTAEPTPGFTDGYYVYIWPNGTIINEEFYDYGDVDRLYHGFFDSQDSLVMVGFTKFNGSNQNILALRCGYDGTLFHSKILGDTLVEQASSICEVNGEYQLLMGQEYIPPGWSQPWRPVQTGVITLSIPNLDSVHTKVVSDSSSYGFDFPAKNYLSSDSNHVFITCSEANDFELIKADLTGTFNNNTIHTRLFRDGLNPCVIDPGDLPLAGWMVSLSGGTNALMSTDSTGRCDYIVATGNHTVEALFPYNGIWTSACNLSQANFSAQYDTIVLPIGLQQGVNCPLMSVDIGTVGLVRGDTSTYSVSYCNYGPQDTVAQIEIELDEDLIYIPGTPPGTPIGNNTFRWNLDTLHSGECGFFTFDALLVDTGTIDGQTHCASATIFPDTLCVDTTGWDQSIIQVAATCLPGDTMVELSVRNTGAATLGFINMYIVEDDVMIKDTAIILGAAANLDFQYPANGSNWVIMADQRPGYPGASRPMAWVEACGVNTSGQISTGHINTWPHDDAEPFRSIDCHESLASLSGLGKIAQPKGFGVADSITHNTQLRYLIYFENETTDTIQTVIVNDTISDFLDPLTLQVGATSHYPFTFSLPDTNVFRWTFTNMNLLPGEFGFVRFRIALRDTTIALPGSVVLNKAFISMFGNGWQESDTVSRIVAGGMPEQVIPGWEEFQTHTKYSLLVYPNPSDGNFTIRLFEAAGQVNAVPYFPQLTLDMTDLSGRLVTSSQHYNTNTIQVSSEGLSSGTYFFRLHTENELIGAGKVQISH